MDTVTSNYKIISFDKESGKITVVWDYTLGTHDIYLPIEDGSYLLGEHLDSYIRGFFPISHYERLNQIQVDGIQNSDLIESLVDTTYVPPVIVPVEPITIPPVLPPVEPPVEPTV